MDVIENEDINKRLHQYIEYKNITVWSLEKKSRITRNSINNALKSQKQGGGGVGIDKIANIIANHPDLNPTWLLTGEGEMIQTTPSSLPVPISLGLKETIILPMKAIGGDVYEQYLSHSKNEVVLLPHYTFRMQMLIHVEGDSMEPTYKEGEAVVLCQVGFDEIRDNDVYVVHTRDGAVIIKRIIADHEQRCYMCASDNRYRYKAFMLKEEDISMVFRVLGKFEPAHTYDSQASK